MKTFDDPRLASGRAQILKERAEEQTPQRLISDDEYAERMKRLAAAEQDAKANKKGLWSDAEMKRWNPPTDEQMQKDYADHKSWFKSVASLVQADPRLAEVSRDSESWKRAARVRAPGFKVNPALSWTPWCGGMRPVSIEVWAGRVRGQWL